MSPLLHLLCLILGIASLAPVKVDADDTVGTVYVQDSVNHDDIGIFSSHFIGVRISNSSGEATLMFLCGDNADANYVLSFDFQRQSEPFFENYWIGYYRRPGTWWIYASQYGTNANFDYIQVRIVPNNWQGPITPQFINPPFTWRYGWPPLGMIEKFTDGTDATGNDGAVATLENPTYISIPAPRRSSTSISVWLAPLLVGIIMIAITVPIVIFAYKKGKQNAKINQVEPEGAMEMKEQQQTDQGINQVEV